MKRWLPVFMGMVLLGVLQAAVVAETGGVTRPDLLVVATVVGSFQATPMRGMLLGMTAGLCTDLFSGRHLGVRTTALALAGLLTALAGGGLYRKYLALVAGVGWLVTLLVEGFTLAVLALLGLRYPWPWAFGGVVVAALWNGVLCAAVYLAGRALGLEREYR